MPSTAGLGQARRRAAASEHFTGHLAPNAAGELALPAALLAQAGLDLGNDLICEAGPNGLSLKADALRKVYVEVTSACNLACATCIRQTWVEPLGYMPLTRYIQLLDGLQGAEGQRDGGGAHPITLSLSGFGEPLVHPEFPALVRLARERGLRIEIITNGTLLDAALARELVALGVSRITVSLDGGDEIAYAAVRGQARAQAVAALVALATVVEVHGASPARAGFKLLVRVDGRWAGNAGGGLEQRVRADAVAALVDGRPRLAHYSLTESGQDALGMLCGGEVTVFIEPFRPRPLLLIVGGGHSGRPLAELARVVGYEVQVVDVRPERGDRPQFDPATITERTYVVLITEDHVTDEAALRQALPTPAPYIGMIGSLRKVGIVLDHLRAEGASRETLARVRAPIGLDTGGREPAEIALAILAEIECVRHGGSGRPRSHLPGKEPANG